MIQFGDWLRGRFAVAVTARSRKIAILAALLCAVAGAGFGQDASPDAEELPPVADEADADTFDEEFGALEDAELEDDSAPHYDPAVEPSAYLNALSGGHSADHCWIEPKNESAKFPRAYQIPGTKVWWKLGGYIKADFIHDFQPAGEDDSFIPTSIPTDDDGGPNTLLQAKATRVNLDVRTPSDWGVIRGFVEGDFFTDNNQFRLRHAYAEVGPLLAGQTWTTFTDPDAIPRTLDFENPITYITLRQAQFRFTLPLTESLSWATAVEDPTTSADDAVFNTIPGQTEQPLPDLVSHLKYEGEIFGWMLAGMLRDLVYRPDVGPEQEELGWAVNAVGRVQLTEQDRLVGQFVYGDGLGRYRSGDDLGLATLTTIDAITLYGSYVGLTHEWTDTLTSNGVYSFAVRPNTDADPPDTVHFATYTAVNLIWEAIENTTIGIEYLYGTNETNDDAFGFANRIQASLQYNFP